MIQAAVALHHFGNGNIRGAKKVYLSSRAYLEDYRPAYHGLDLDAFLAQYERCFAEVLASTEEFPRIEIDPELIPEIHLDPALAGEPEAEWLRRDDNCPVARPRLLISSHESDHASLECRRLTFDETRFTGVVRLFPLPDLVMFPHVMQPLHIFEPRYREMLNDALDGDGLIAMSMLAPGWEDDYDGRPALLPHVCLGKVVTHQRLDDGRYNLMLLGMRRGRIIAELPATRSFRQAEVELIDDVYSADGRADRDELQAQLAAQFQQTLPLAKSATNEGPVQELLAEEVPLGVLTDLVSFALPLEAGAEARAAGRVRRRPAGAMLLLDAMGSRRRSRLPSD